MAIYRFRVTFEDYDEIYREIDMPSKSSFVDLHQAIHQSTGYDADRSSSFYVSNDQWKRGQEIAYKPDARKTERGTVLLMKDIRLSKFIDDPHQKFYYVYNFDSPYEFHVELVRILKEESGKDYPSTFRSVGAAPKPRGTAVVIVEDDDDEVGDTEELDAEEYGVEEEDLSFLDEEEAEGGNTDNIDEY